MKNCKCNNIFDVADVINRNTKAMAKQFKRVDARINVGITLVIVALYCIEKHRQRIDELEIEMDVLKIRKGD